MHQPWISRIGWFVAVIITLLVVSILTGPKLGGVIEALTAPILPDAIEIPTADWHGDQNWTEAVAHEFHFKSQGSRTLNVPLSWFLAMEEPGSGILSSIFFEQDKFGSPAYLSRFGFLAAEKNALNPDGLPIGFATAPYQKLVGLDEPQTAIGFTCAACHTGQLVYEGQRYIVEGGSAVIDLELLTKAIGASLGQTLVSSKIPFLNGRFDRFAKRILGSQYTDQNVVKLNGDLSNVVEQLAAIPNGIDVTEGFSRLDALNRIGNQVFAADPERPENYVNINAPVNFPHIWTSSWFSWVQYDGSIMQPLIRNVGEAMGTAAYTNFSAPISHGRFSNAIPIANLDWIESRLSGDQAPVGTIGFTGLRAPTWPTAFPPVDIAKAKQGARLYAENCSGCHLPALTRQVETGHDADSRFWQHFKPISWKQEGAIMTTRDSLLDVNIIPQAHIGTDPGQGNVLAQRTIDTSGAIQNDPGMGIVVDICVSEPQHPVNLGGQHLVTTATRDDPLVPYPYALGAVVQLSINQWFDRHNYDAKGRLALQGDRPNCLQAGKGYKARPLNGVWATAPFLHNGSVPTIAHLLGPADDRPESFLLGDASFDPNLLGIKVVVPDGTSKTYSDDGYFILRTTVSGNSNQGHEFSNVKSPGVIGRALSDAERESLLEFLKTM